MKSFPVFRLNILKGSRILLAILCLCICACPALCNTDNVKKVIEQAQNMTLEELAQKAIEESNGQFFCAIGGSSRGNVAIPLFIKYLKSIDPDYELDYLWQTVVNNNKAIEQILADSKKRTGTISLVQLPDGVQIQEKLIYNNAVMTFIPKEWREAGGIFAGDKEWLSLMPFVIKTFIFNNLSGKEWLNCWDFVYKDAKGYSADIEIVPVSKSFLYTLTKDKYADILADAFEALDGEKKSYFQPIVDSLAKTSDELGLGSSGKYALTWIKLWIENYIPEMDTATNALVANRSSENQFGFYVYSKLRDIEETKNVSKAFVTVAPYQDGYKGIGGGSHGSYLFLTSNCPLPWTACAFLAYVTCTAEGFSPWGKDIGSYSSNPKVDAAMEATFHYSRAGYDENGVNKFDVYNDRGYLWWIEKGNIVVEDPDYCEQVAFTVGEWVESLLSKRK